MRLPTWLLFTFLIVAAFAPAAGRWRGWWFIYYGALFVCWVWMSVVAARRAAREDRKRQRKIARLLRQHRNAQKIALDEANVRGVPRALPIVRRRFIAAADRSDTDDEIRKLTGGGDDAIVITDRRKEDRRHRIDGYVMERRHSERRRQDIRSLLLTRGWAEVKPVITNDEEATF